MVRSRQKFSSKDAKGVSAITNFFRQTDHTASLCHPEESRTSRTSETPDIDTSDTSSCQPESACMLDSFNCPGSIITTTEVSNIPSASSGSTFTLQDDLNASVLPSRLVDRELFIMFLTRSEYDRGVNTFSPEGRLFQVEYAIEAIKLGSTAIGIQTSEGVVLAVEKRVTSPLIETASIEKVMEVDDHIGCAMSGLIADSRTLIDKARVEAQNHWFTYNEKMSVESVTQAVSNLALQFGDDDADPGAMSRPFGVALLFAGIDHKGPQLFHMDPSGTFIQYDAKAIGSGSEGAQQALQDVYHKSMTLKEACKNALTILKQVMEEKLNSTNVEMGTVTPQKKFHMFTKEELEDVIKEI
ncbi:Proteasome subunit alpha type-5 [Mizuhopecten yessoensis]|uniref:Proteasome subunit alpha type-5 n=2 Tax=Mizuhopecten yessoensis TaxID=6573 RepID=A0A210R4I2_MIZYE|nr:Proteasome subunit alpha type-5 [Mizuhopecten yessoensis]